MLSQKVLLLMTFVAMFANINGDKKVTTETIFATDNNFH